MRNYFICLLDSDSDGVSYQRGDIVMREAKVGPPGTPWASFEPPAGLSGIPVLVDVDDDGMGGIVFRYTIKNGMGFSVSARIGLPQASAVIERTRHLAEDSETLQPKEKIELKYGAGLAATASRSFVGWTGKSKPVPPPPEENLFHPLDDGIDWLRR